MSEVGRELYERKVDLPTSSSPRRRIETVESSRSSMLTVPQKYVAYKLGPNALKWS